MTGRNERDGSGISTRRACRALLDETTRAASELAGRAERGRSSIAGRSPILVRAACWPLVQRSTILVAAIRKMKNARRNSGISG